MSTTRTPQRQAPKIEPPVFDLVRLVRGPLHGQRVKVARGSTLSLPTRPRRGKHDKPPCACYAGDSSTGTLEYAGTVGMEHQ